MRPDWTLTALKVWFQSLDIEYSEEIDVGVEVVLLYSVLIIPAVKERRP